MQHITGLQLKRQTNVFLNDLLQKMSIFDLTGMRLCSSLYVSSNLAEQRKNATAK